MFVRYNILYTKKAGKPPNSRDEHTHASTKDKQKNAHHRLASFASMSSSSVVTLSSSRRLVSSAPLCASSNENKCRPALKRGALLFVLSLKIFHTSAHLDDDAHAHETAYLHIMHPTCLYENMEWPPNDDGARARGCNPIVSL